MQYILLIHSSEARMQAATQEDVGRMTAAYAAYTEAMSKAGMGSRMSRCGMRL